jgi:hypothetical protein
MYLFCKPDPTHRTHHLRVVPTSFPRFRDKPTFRDLPRTHPDVAREHAALKRRLARELQHDREVYTEAKGDWHPGRAWIARPSDERTIGSRFSVVATVWGGRLDAWLAFPVSRAERHHIVGHMRSTLRRPCPYLLSPAGSSTETKAVQAQRFPGLGLRRRDEHRPARPKCYLPPKTPMSTADSCSSTR